MKPLPFDMTPLAKALDMPTTQQKQAPTKKLKPAPAQPAKSEKRPSPERRTVALPQRFSLKSGWISTLAAEQIHALATHVLARHTEQGLRTLAVTSSMAGEGKTTVTLALAQKLASAGKRVLIIDLDTHRGTLSREAELEDADGALETSTVTNGTATAFHSYATDNEGVSIMPTGRVRAGVENVPLLDPSRIRGLAQRGLEENDIVILDCPPLLPVADTHVIGDVVDSAILVVRAGATPREVLKRALTDFGKEKFFAAILNRARPQNIPYFSEVYGYYRRDSSKG